MLVANPRHNNVPAASQVGQQINDNFLFLPSAKVAGQRLAGPFGRMGVLDAAINHSQKFHPCYYKISETTILF